MMTPGYWRPNRLLNRALLAALLLMCLAGCVYVVPPTPAEPTPTPLAPAWAKGQLEIHVIAVDHGDAQLIVSPTGETMLIDGARAEFAAHVAQVLTRVLGEPAVDYLLISHYHVDHIQGIVPLVQEHGLEVRRAVLDRGGDRSEYDSDPYRAYHDYVTDPSHGLTRQRLRVDDTIDMGPEVSMKVLAAGDIDSDTNRGLPIKHENDMCIALWLTFGQFDYWTAGDLNGVNSLQSTNIETAVIPHLPREADVYRVNHHAIDYNSNPEFLVALDPTACLASTYTAMADWPIILRLQRHCDVYITGTVPPLEPSGDIRMVATDGGARYQVEDTWYTSK